MGSGWDHWTSSGYGSHTFSKVQFIIVRHAAYEFLKEVVRCTSMEKSVVYVYSSIGHNRC